MGTFDGVHRGHRSILSRMIREAHEDGTVAVVVVFSPHPRKVVDPAGANQVKLLTTLGEKEAQMRELGLDHFVILPFTHDIARLPYHDFVREYLFEPLHMARYYAGYDHGFGRDRQGDFGSLRLLGEELGFEVSQMQPVIEGVIAVSSSRIRRALEDGDVHGAALMLGRPYSLSGEVVYGNRIGKTIGFPTANIQTHEPDKLIPAMGVYAVRVDVAGQSYDGMLNIGIRPTIDLHAVTIEVNIFDFEQDIYGERIEVRFFERIREEKRFHGLKELREQLMRDQEASRAILAYERP